MRPTPEHLTRLREQTAASMRMRDGRYRPDPALILLLVDAERAHTDSHTP